MMHQYLRALRVLRGEISSVLYISMMTSIVWPISNKEVSDTHETFS